MQCFYYNALLEPSFYVRALKTLTQDVDAEVSAGLDQYDPELIDGVRVLWIAEGTAACDETAFRHALKTGHRLRAAGQRLTDAAIIDAYNVAQTHGGAGRPAELPPDARPSDDGPQRWTKAAQRWKTDPQGEYAQERRATLSAATNRRTATGKSNAFRIAAFFADTFGQSGQYPVYS